MKKTIIIKKNYEFKNFFNKGKYISGKYIEIFIHKNNKQKNQLGIVVSKKIGKSVVRNRIKRLIRESYTIVEENISEKINMLIVWKKKSNIEDATFYNIKQDLEKILIKANVLGKE